MRVWEFDLVPITAYVSRFSLVGKNKKITPKKPYVTALILKPTYD